MRLLAHAARWSLIVASMMPSGVCLAQDSAATTTYRGRIIGVFDRDRGEPVAGARIVDVKTGLSALTTATGTLSLFFVDTAGSLLQIRKLGYEPQMLFVANSPGDTVPLTIVLAPMAQALPGIVTRAASTRGAADTVRALELNGFYERRNTSGAPGGAFLTHEKVGRLSLLKDLPALSGRAICRTNTWINGIKVDLESASIPDLGNRNRRSQVKAPMRSGLDALVTPSEVLGVEMYRVGDTPPQYNPTSRELCGATLIWTR